MTTSTSPPPRDRLTAGTHLTPDDGVCLMEWVSALAGQPWSDAPVTTHPLLAHLGRLVNDAMTPTGRQDLVALADRLAGMNSDGPALDAELVLMATSYALDVRSSLRLAWMHNAASRHARLASRSPTMARPGRSVIRLRQRIYRHGPAHRAIEAAVITLCRTPDPDRRLYRLLDQAITLVETSTGRHRQEDCSPRVQRPEA